MPKTLLTAAAWGAALKPPVAGSRARLLIKRLDPKYLQTVPWGSGVRIMVRSDAPDPREPRGWKKGRKRPKKTNGAD